MWKVSTGDGRTEILTSATKPLSLDDVVELLSNKLRRIPSPEVVCGGIPEPLPALGGVRNAAGQDWGDIPERHRAGSTGVSARGIFEKDSRAANGLVACALGLEELCVEGKAQVHLAGLHSQGEIRVEGIWRPLDGVGGVVGVVAPLPAVSKPSISEISSQRVLPVHEIVGHDLCSTLLTTTDFLLGVGWCQERRTHVDYIDSSAD